MHDKIRDPGERYPCAGPYGGLAACGSDEPSGVTGPDRTASTPTETPASSARTASTPGSGDAPTATDAPGTAAATAPPAVSGSAETDREALVALYNATNGENWRYNDNWLSDAPLGEWYGVNTNDDGRVIALDFNGNGNGNGLSGEIPAELGSLSNLRELGLSINNLSEEIPAELGSLSNLRTLSLGENALSGEIPAELGSLSNLRTLYLHINELSGEIPAELGSLSNLEVLRLGANSLSGCVPSSLEDQLIFYASDLGDLPFCGTGPDRTAPTPTETPASSARTASTPVPSPTGCRSSTRQNWRAFLARLTRRFTAH